MASDDAERVQVMTAVLLDIWQQAQRWREEESWDEHPKDLAADVFTAFGPLAAFEASHEGPLLEWMPDSRGSGMQ